MSVDLGELLAFSVSPLELVVRGVAMYGFLLLVFRFLLRRDGGAIGMADVLLLVLIADAAQNAMAGEYRSVSDGFVLVGTIVACNALIDWAAFRFPRFRAIAQPPALPLVRNGRVLRRNLRQEMLSEEDLRAKMREHGLDDFAEVRVAYMESDGQVTVVPFTADRDRHGGRRVPGAAPGP